MPFSKGDPKTIAAAKRGGKTGKKYLATVSKEKQREFGKASGEARRALAAKRRADEEDERKAAEPYLL